MNKAFKKGKFAKYYGSRFYKACLPKMTYTQWLKLQSNAYQDLVLGKSGGAAFRCQPYTARAMSGIFKPAKPPFSCKSKLQP